MEFRMEHVARVTNANINLDGITLVAGGNGCGKSTISKAMYLVLDSYYELPLKVRAERSMSVRRFFMQWMHNELDNRLSIEERNELRTALYHLILTSQETVESFGEQITRILGVYGYSNIDTTDLLEWYTTFKEKADVYYLDYIIQRGVQQIFSDELNTFNQDDVANIIFDADDKVYYVSVEAGRVVRNQSEYITTNIQPIYITTSDLIDSVGSYDKLNSAIRTRSVSSPNSNLAKLLMREIDMNDLVVEEYEELQRQQQLGKEIFNEVLEGELYLQSNKLQYFDKTYKRDISLSNLASGMRIFLIIKRLIENGTFLRKSCLIIDEPETNLHPEWQLHLAHLLVLIYKKLGVRVYVNSHSPYFVRALEYYADELQVLDRCSFYSMESSEQHNMFYAKDVTEKLGDIYDKLAGPFNRIM